MAWLLQNRYIHQTRETKRVCETKRDVDKYQTPYRDPGERGPGAGEEGGGDLLVRVPPEGGLTHGHIRDYNDSSSSRKLPDLRIGDQDIELGRGGEGTQESTLVRVVVSRMGERKEIGYGDDDEATMLCPLPPPLICSDRCITVGSKNSRAGSGDDSFF